MPKTLPPSAAHRIHEALYPGNAHEAAFAIRETYKEQSFCFANFLYFANAHFSWLYRIQEKRPEYAEKYFQALLDSDFLLPDGVALSMVHYRRKHPEISGVRMLARYTKIADASLSNLNGTDFMPEFLSETIGAMGAENLCIILYGARPETVERAARVLRDQFGAEVRHQDGYGSFRTSLFDNLEGKTPLFLVGLGSPKQEIFVESMKDFLKSKKAMVFTVGGLFDFLGGFEKRAPEWVRRIRWEWIWRLVVNPKKNFRKVMASFQSLWYILFGMKE